MFTRKISRYDTVAIYICSGTAYLPTQVRYLSEEALDGEPVYICAMDKAALVDAIEKILDAQKIRLPDPESITEAWKNASSVILRATKKRSWLQLAKDCTVYMVTWRQEEVILSKSRLDKKGRFEFPTSLQTKYPGNISVADLVNIILEDYDFRNRLM